MSYEVVIRIVPGQDTPTVTTSGGAGGGTEEASAAPPPLAFEELVSAGSSTAPAPVEPAELESVAAGGAGTGGAAPPPIGFEELHQSSFAAAPAPEPLESLEGVASGGPPSPMEPEELAALPGGPDDSGGTEPGTDEPPTGASSRSRTARKRSG